MLKHKLYMSGETGNGNPPPSRQTPPPTEKDPVDTPVEPTNPVKPK